MKIGLISDTHITEKRGKLINPGSPNRPIKSDASIAILTIDNTEYENKLDKISIEFIKIEK